MRRRGSNGGAAVASVVAGRTDAGVHAAGQVARRSTWPTTWAAEDMLRDALNFHMKPHRVAVVRGGAGAGWAGMRGSRRGAGVSLRASWTAAPGRRLVAGRVWHVPHRL